MKSPNTTWEIIIAGCIFTALGVYLLTPSQLSIPTPELDHQQVELDIAQPPGEPSVSEDFVIDLKELQNLKQLKELKHMEKLEDVENELEKLEHELKSQTIQLNMLPSPSLKNLSGFLISSP